MKRLIAGFALLILAACGGGGGPPTPGPPAPLPVPRPGVQLFSATWAPTLGAALYCVGGGPFSCTLPPGALWGVLPQPGNGGAACVDPEPNVCFQVNAGQLDFHASAPGMALISAATVPGGYVLSEEAVVTLTSMDCSTVAFVGPVIYNGEGAAGDPTGGYWAMYLSCPGDGGPVRVWLYGPTRAYVIWSGAIQLGSTHALRMDFVPDVSVTFYLDGSAIYTATPANNPDPFTFTQDPHPALWFGVATGAVGRFDVYGAPP